MAEAENKLERFSRRNNLRIVGLKEKSGELVSKILSEKMDMNDPQLARESASRRDEGWYRCSFPAYVGENVEASRQACDQETTTSTAGGL